ncbi:hypothetical protein B0H19DRAFT_1261658 [Mycena capillaripes]|nr:hypothetical protein B0H19DRAFT_1261658 [Mycena capillaripes]
MFPTRARAMISTQLRRRTAPPEGTGGSAIPDKPAWTNNNMVRASLEYLLAAGGAMTLFAAYLVGFAAANKEKDTAKILADASKTKNIEPRVGSNEVVEYGPMVPTKTTDVAAKKM